MKSTSTFILIASLCAAVSLPAAEPAEADAPKAEANTEASHADKSLHMNFREASLDQVLTYLSDAAGFIINIKPGTSVRGKVTVMSSEPLSKDEAVNLLNTVLNQNNLAAVQNGRTLNIMPRDEAKIAGIPVMSGADPENIPITDKIVTQIMPVRFVEAAQLLKDLQPLVSIQTTMTANEAGNSIVMTDTQANVHKVAEIIRAIDMGAEDFTMLKVFPLNHADPVDTADMLTQLFSEDTSRQGGQSGLSTPFFGGGFRGRLAALAGGQRSQSGNTQDQRLKKRNRVVAYADQRTASVVVSASRDLMDQIEDVVHELDGNPRGQKKVLVLDTGPSDAAELLPVLTEIFNKSNQSNSRQNTAASSTALSQRSTSQSSSSTMGTSSTSRTGGTGLGQTSRIGSGGGGFGGF